MHGGNLLTHVLAVRDLLAFKHPSNAHLLTVTYGARGSMVVADGIALIVTWSKTFRQWYTIRRLALDVQRSISACLLRDGMLFTNTYVYYTQ